MNKIIETELYFKNIDCASCAAKIEKLLNKDENIIEARVNFISKKIIISYNEGIDIIKLVETISRKIEVDACISLTEFEEDHHHEHNHECGCEHHHEHNHECGCEHHHNHEHECGCEHHHEHHHECEHLPKHKLKFNISKLLFIIGLIIGVTASILKFCFDNQIVWIISRCLFIVSYILLAYKIIIKSFKNIKQGNIFDENLLMMVASVGALIINESIEAILVVLLYTIGEYFQNKALGKSTNAIAGLTKLKVEYSTLVSGEQILTKDVKIDDVIIVKVGERIPLDGIIIEGNTSLDVKVLTGESMPKDVIEGDEVLSGCINLQKVILVKVTKSENESTTSKIIKMVELASNKKSKTEEFITKFASIYTPIVLSLAVIVFLVEWLLIDYFTINDALNNAFVFLVTSCPCALVISIPLAFFGGIGKCSSFGILVKGGNYIEALSKTKVICFDKTGTLTKGNFNVVHIEVNEENKDLLVDYIVAVESYSNHPIAKACVKLKAKNSNLEVNEVTETSGHGLKAIVDGRSVIIGNDKLLKSHNIEFTEINHFGTIIYCAVNNKYLGALIIVDEIKEESSELINNLKKLNIKTHMLTGDKNSVAVAVGERLGIDYVESELLPLDKLNRLENIINNHENNQTVVYVGDGINDTPAIKLADVGIAIGGFGNDEAVEVSDVVLMSNNMNSLVKAIKTARFTKMILTQNIIFALGIKFIALIIGVIGILGSYGMLLGVFADVGVCLIAILNTLRILKHGDK